jgi:hypothetical protein
VTLVPATPKTGKIRPHLKSSLSSLEPSPYELWTQATHYQLTEEPKFLPDS